MGKKIYCPFCGNPSLVELRDTQSIDHEWFNEATSTINELRQRAEAAEARAATFSETIETLVNEKAQAEIELNVWKARALSAEALWHGAEAERDNERRMVESLSRECNDLTRQLENAQERIDSYDKADRALNQALNEGDGVYMP